MPVIKAASPMTIRTTNIQPTGDLFGLSVFVSLDAILICLVVELVKLV
jgi:hypothetical protein